MIIPVVTGDGEWIPLDSDDYGWLVLLPEVCEDVDPHLWDLFAAEPVSVRGHAGDGRDED